MTSDGEYGTMPYTFFGDPAVDPRIAVGGQPGCEQIGVPR